MTFDETLNRFIILRGEKKDVAALGREIQNELNNLEIVILKDFEESGKSKVTMNGETVYLKRDFFAGFAKDDSGEPVSAVEAMRALKDAGLEEFCPEKINTTSLTAYFKELKEDGKDIPEKLVGKFVINEVFKISSRKA